MSEESNQPAGPDLATDGLAIEDIDRNGMVAGHVGPDAVLVAHVGSNYLAIGATCTHYGGPLAEGLLVGDTVRCPWHHACFSLRTGEALRAPGFEPVSRWRVERKGDRLFVRERESAPPPAEPIPASAKEINRIAIVGGGAAGFAGAEMLRRKGFAGDVTIFSDDVSPPPDRPNLSKDYLAGKAPEDWIPLRPPEFYEDRRIALRLDTKVSAIDPGRRELVLVGGESLGYDRLLLATGAEPVKLDIPGGDLPHVHRLRSVSDCRAIIADADPSHRAVVIGASFIGLEVAASLRTRGLAVHVVAPEEKPLARLLGEELGEFVHRIHEEHGVVFHLKTTVVEIGKKTARLKDGTTLDADLVVVGIGVRPRVALAEAAGLAVDNGVLVDEFLESSVSGIFAAGDIARWPDPRLGERLRIEHWVVAERQGQIAARNMLGAREPCDLVPFFWAQQYDVPINYVGHAAAWDRIAVEGSITGRDCMVRYERGGRVLAGASIFRDKESLELELAMEREKKA